MIENLLDGIPARQKLLMLDACHSGEDGQLLQDKRNVEEAPLTMAANVVVKTRAGLGKAAGLHSVGTGKLIQIMREMFTNLKRGSGTTIIAAAAADEVALERSNEQNGLLTDAFLEGLRRKAADRNRDGRVTVSELHRYVNRQVYEKSGKRQNPSSRQENYENDFEL